MWGWNWFSVFKKNLTHCLMQLNSLYIIIHSLFIQFYDGVHKRVSNTQVLIQYDVIHCIGCMVKIECGAWRKKGYDGTNMRIKWIKTRISVDKELDWQHVKQLHDLCTQQHQAFLHCLVCLLLYMIFSSFITHKSRRIHSHTRMLEPTHIIRSLTYH